MSNMPAPNSAFLDKNGNVTPAWWALLLTLVSPTSNGGTTGILQVIQAEIAALKASQSVTPGATWDAGLAVLTAPASDVVKRCAVAGTIRSVTVLTGGGPGSCQIDIWKAPYGGYPPVLANSITGATPPTVTSGIKTQDGVLAGWKTSVSAGDILLFHLVSTTNFTNIHIELEITP